MDYLGQVNDVTVDTASSQHRHLQCIWSDANVDICTTKVNRTGPGYTRADVRSSSYDRIPPGSAPELGPHHGPSVVPPSKTLQDGAEVESYPPFPNR